MSYRKKRVADRQKPNRSPQDFNIAEYGDIDNLRMLPSASITSGLRYQRAICPEDVATLVREWDDKLFQPLIVSFRDGRFNLIDGQHRLTALHEMNHGNSVMVLCRILTNLTYEQEAELCAKFDRTRKPLSLAESINARMEADSDPQIKEILRLMRQYGFSWTVGQKKATPYCISVSGTVIRTYEFLGTSLFDRMLRLLYKTWLGDPASLSASLISGLALFLKTYETEISDTRFVTRLSKYSPQEIERCSKNDFTTNKKALRCARVLLECFNAGRGGQKLPYRFC